MPFFTMPCFLARSAWNSENQSAVGAMDSGVGGYTLILLSRSIGIDVYNVSNRSFIWCAKSLNEMSLLSFRSS